MLLSRMHGGSAARDEQEREDVPEAAQDHQGKAGEREQRGDPEEDRLVDAAGFAEGVELPNLDDLSDFGVTWMASVKPTHLASEPRRVIPLPIPAPLV